MGRRTLGVHIRAELGEGLTEVVPVGGHGLRHLGLDVLRLRPGERHEAGSGACEIACVILSGRVSAGVHEHDFGQLGARRSVFDGRAWCLFVPRDAAFRFEALEDVEIALCKARAAQPKTARVVSPDEVRLRKVGQGNWWREVHDIIDERFDADRLLVGETYNAPGNWSSVPPHKHDVEAPPSETALEEIYFFRVDPTQGFGLQRLYDQSGFDQTYTIHQNDAVVIAGGYHPVVAAPGYRLYYLWFLAGQGRSLRIRDDPAHAWIKRATTS